jgi:hypothetical protein
LKAYSSGIRPKVGGIFTFALGRKSRLSTHSSVP